MARDIATLQAAQKKVDQQILTLPPSSVRPHSPIRRHPLPPQ
jgi:hypothetical protein